MREKLTADEARRLLDYDPDTGVLTWKARTPDMFHSRGKWSTEALCKSWNSRYSGKQAGTTYESNYRNISINYRFYKAHRLAYLIMTGSWPDQYIDHCDNSVCTNQWGNLRAATPSQNAWNSRKRVDNSSGFKGVYFNKLARKWHAQITVRGVRVYLGLFNTPEEAHDAYVASAKLHFGEFARVS